MPSTRRKHENTKKFLGCVIYKTHRRHIRSDLKVTAIRGDCNKATQNSVSYAIGIVVSKLFTRPKRTGLYVNHLHLEQRM